MIHSAGGRAIHTRDDAAFAEVLCPKVLGTVVLDERGNAFLDTFAQHRHDDVRSADVRTVAEALQDLLSTLRFREGSGAEVGG